MKSLYLLVIATVTLSTLLATPTGAGEIVQPAGERDLTMEEAGYFMSMVYDRRPYEGLAYLDSMKTHCEGWPLYQIMVGRGYQELIPADDYDVDYGRAVSEPSLQALDVAIAYCSSRIDNDDPDMELYFYRGWAWLAKSLVRSYTRNLYTAGREAGRGKKDMLTYIEFNPHNPVAIGLLGGFLYFADTIPGAFKFLSKLLFLPSGDRDQGLEYIQRALDMGGLMETDWALILYNVYFYFEGRYEEGLEGLVMWSELEPAYLRTAIPLAVSRPFAPRFVDINEDMIDNAMRVANAGPSRDIAWNALYVTQAFRGYGDRMCNHSRLAASRYQSIMHESPKQPDWVESFVRLQLGHLQASKGEWQNATDQYDTILRSYPYYHDQAKRALKDLDKYADLFTTPGSGRPDDWWITAVYRAEADTVRALAARFDKLSKESLEAKYYAGECYLRLGELDQATDRYSDVIAGAAPIWEQPYQMIAATRIAGIKAEKGQYEKAAVFQKRAMDFYNEEYLVDWVLEGRQRYYERLADGTETVLPTLLTVAP